MKQRKGIQIIATQPYGKHIIFPSKREACRRIGCRKETLNNAIRKSRLISIGGDDYCLDELDDR